MTLPRLTLYLILAALAATILIYLPDAVQATLDVL
jgi:hypothetical protein